MIVLQNKKIIIGVIYITILTIIAFIYALSIIPSPSMERNITADHKRVTDLGTLQQNIDSYYQTNSVLPQSLKELTSNTYDPTTPLDKTDPETKQPYIYKIVDPSDYKLCAIFQTSSLKEDPTTDDTSDPTYSTYSSLFKHPIGYHCFSESENGTGGSNLNMNAVPTMTCLGNGCQVTPTPLPPTPGFIPITNHTPTATLSSFDSSGTCTWTPTFTLTGFAPNNYINVNSNGTLSDQCNPNKTHAYSWTGGWNQATDANGDVTISYSQNDYGDYTYTFTDSYGDTATVHYQNGPTTGPTIIPTPVVSGGAGGGGGGGSDG